MTIASGCRGSVPPPQHHPLGQLDARQPQNRRLEISMTITIGDASSCPGKTHGANDKGALFDAQGNPLNFDDQHLYGGTHQRANGQQEQSGHHAGRQDGVGSSNGHGFNHTERGETGDQEGPEPSGRSVFESLGRDIDQGNQRLQQQTLESLQLIDRTMAETTIDACIAQSEKMVVDTRNAISNGYVDSASKANNAATQSGKGINF